MKISVTVCYIIKMINELFHIIEKIKLIVKNTVYINYLINIIIKLMLYNITISQ